MMDTAGMARVPAAPPRVDTPLGAVTFAVDAGVPLPAPPDTCWRLTNGTLLHQWRTRGFDVELLLGPIGPRIPEHFPPVTLWAAVWRVEAHRAVPGQEIAAGLTAAVPDVDGGPSSGQHLDAVTLEHATAVVSIGGPDVEAQQDQTGQELPARWKPLFGWGSEFGARYVDDQTVRWRFPGLARPETVELTIAVAWSEPTEEVATWMAVSVPRGSALRQLTA